MKSPWSKFVVQELVGYGPLAVVLAGALFFNHHLLGGNTDIGIVVAYVLPGITVCYNIWETIRSRRTYRRVALPVHW